MQNPVSNRRLLVWFSLGHMANDWAPSAIWLIAPAIAVAMDLSPADVGLLITIASFGGALAYLPAGLLADRVANRGRLLLGTFWWVGIGYVVAAFGPDFWSVALLLALAGMGDAAWHPIATGVLTQTMPLRKAHALGIHAMGGTFAEVLAPLVVGVLLSVFDWRTALQVSAIPALVMGLAFLRIARAVPASPHRAISRADLKAMWRAWRSGQGLGLLAVITIYNMALFAVLAMAPLFLQRVHGMTPAETGVVFAVMVLVGAATQPLVGRISDGAGRKPVFITGNLAAVATCLAIAASTSPAATVAALVATIAVLYSIRSAVLAAAVEFAGRREGTTLGLAFALLDGVGALGALMAGAVGSLDLHYAFALAAGLAATAAAAAAPLAFRNKAVPSVQAAGE